MLPALLEQVLAGASHEMPGGIRLILPMPRVSASQRPYGQVSDIAGLKGVLRPLSAGCEFSLPAGLMFMRIAFF